MIDETLAARATHADAYDAAIKSLMGRPDTVHTAMVAIVLQDPMQTHEKQYTLRTFRVREEGDHICLTYVGAEGSFRLVLPPKVAAMIARQRDVLSSKNRKTAARAEAARRKAQGIEPGFMKARKAKKKGAS